MKPLVSDFELTEVSRPDPDGYFIRSGGCDQCAQGDTRGECCTKLAFPVTVGAASNPDIVHFWKLHGVETKWWGQIPIVVIPIRCSMLTRGGDCALFGSDERPNICSQGPLNPWAAQINPACSYVFEQAKE